MPGVLQGRELGPLLTQQQLGLMPRFHCGLGNVTPSSPIASCSGADAPRRQPQRESSRCRGLLVPQTDPQRAGTSCSSGDGQTSWLPVIPLPQLPGFFPKWILIK